MAASAKRADAALTAGFTVTVDPPDVGARLWLGPLSDVEIKDGKALLKDLPDGEQELTVQAPGYQPFTTRVTVKDGRGSVEAKLVPVRGAVTVTARPGTQVTAVDERGRETRLGTVPPGGVLDVANLLTVGRYTLKLDHADCARGDRTRRRTGDRPHDQSGSGAGAVARGVARILGADRRGSAGEWNGGRIDSRNNQEPAQRAGAAGRSVPARLPAHGAERDAQAEGGPHAQRWHAGGRERRD